MFKDFC
jgi:hypothetical protein